MSMDTWLPPEELKEREKLYKRARTEAISRLRGKFPNANLADIEDAVHDAIIYFLERSDFHVPWAEEGRWIGYLTRVAKLRYINNFSKETLIPDIFLPLEEELSEEEEAVLKEARLFEIEAEELNAKNGVYKHRARKRFVKDNL